MADDYVTMQRAADEAAAAYAEQQSPSPPAPEPDSPPPGSGITQDQWDITPPSTRQIYADKYADPDAEPVKPLPTPAPAQPAPPLPATVPAGLNLTQEAWDAMDTATQQGYVAAHERELAEPAPSAILAEQQEKTDWLQDNPPPEPSVAPREYVEWIENNPYATDAQKAEAAIIEKAGFTTDPAAIQAVARTFQSVVVNDAKGNPVRINLDTDDYRRVLAIENPAERLSGLIELGILPEGTMLISDVKAYNAEFGTNHTEDAPYAVPLEVEYVNQKVWTEGAIRVLTQNNLWEVDDDGNLVLDSKGNKQIAPEAYIVAAENETILAALKVLGTVTEDNKITVVDSEGVAKEITVVEYARRHFATERVSEFVNEIGELNLSDAIRSGLDDAEIFQAAGYDITSEKIDDIKTQIAKRDSATETLSEFVNEIGELNLFGAVKSGLDDVELFQDAGYTGVTSDTISETKTQIKDTEDELAVVEETVTAEEAVALEAAEASADELAVAATTYRYRDPETGTRNITVAERNDILASNPSARDLMTLNMPWISDTVKEILSFGAAETATFNLDDLGEQYEQQKAIALATLLGDTDKLEELYQAGAFGDDEKSPTWDYRDPDGGIRNITRDERDEIIAEFEAGRQERLLSGAPPQSHPSNLMTTGKGVTTAPQAYKDTLTAVQQSADIDSAVASGDVVALGTLYDTGAFGDDRESFVNLIQYVNDGGRELSPTTAKDVKAVSDSFGTKQEYADEIIAAQPTNLALAKDIGIAMIPIYGTIYYWDEMGGGMKGVSIVADVLTFIPFIGGISAAAKVAGGVGRAARLAAALKIVPRIAIAEVKAPFTALRHPLNTTKAVANEVRNIGEWMLRPSQRPLSVMTTVHGTARLDASIPGSAEASMHIRDTLMKMAARGDKPVYTWGGKTYVLREPDFMREGGVVAAGPDMGWVETPGGAEVSLKKTATGERVSVKERGWFVSNSALERFTGSSAFGLEKIGVGTIDDQLKALVDAADVARKAGETKKASQLEKLVADWKKALKAGDIKALNKAEAKIAAKLADMATDKTTANINRLLKDANEQYVLGNIEVAQASMSEVVALRASLARPKPGFAVMSPETTVKLDLSNLTGSAIASEKLYPGVIFKPKPGELWSIALADVHADRAAQLLKQADDAKRLGQTAKAAELNAEATELVRSGKSGFRKFSTAEMELKYPEMFQLPELKARLFTRSAGQKLFIFTEAPRGFKDIVRSKLMGPIEQLRNIYKPALSVSSMPLTDVQRLAKIDTLTEFADSLDANVIAWKAKGDIEGAASVIAADTRRASLARLEIVELQKGMSGIAEPGARAAGEAIKHTGIDPLGRQIGDKLRIRFDGIQEGIGSIPDQMMFTDIARTGSTFVANNLKTAKSRLVSMRSAFAKADAPTLQSAIKTSKVLDEADEYIQAARKAEALGDTVSADRLLREAENIRLERLSGREYARMYGDRAGTVMGVAQLSRVLGVRRAAMRGREPIRVPLRTPSRLTEQRALRASPLRDSIARIEGTRIPDVRVPDTRIPDTRLPDTRLPDTRIPDTRLPADRVPADRVPDTRIPDTRIPDDRTPTKRVPDDRTPTKRVPDMRIPTPSVEEAGKRKKIPDGSITWVQGRLKRNGVLRPVWKYVEPPYTQKKPYTLFAPPLGAVRTGGRIPEETVQAIGAVKIKRANIDLGIVDIQIDDYGRKITFTGGGLKTDVGMRVPGPTMGMSIPGEGAITSETIFGAVPKSAKPSRIVSRKPKRKANGKTKWLGGESFEIGEMTGL